MFQVTKKVKIVTVVLMVLSTAFATILMMTHPIELAREDRLMKLPPAQVMELTRNRVKVARQYALFYWMVPFALQRYPKRAFQQMNLDLKAIETSKDPSKREKATYNLRLHGKLIFETVEGQLRKARNASAMMAFGLCLIWLGGVFVLMGWLRTMFSFMVVGTFCAGLPVKDHLPILALMFYVPLCFGLITFWLVRDNPPSKVMPYNEIDEHF